MAEAALGMGGLWVHEYRTLAGSAQLEERLRRSLALVPPDSTLALRLRVRLAGEASYRTGAPGRILTVLDEARPVDDPGARGQAMGTPPHSLPGPEHGALLVGIRWYQGRLVELMPMLADLVDSTTLSGIDNSCLSAYAVAAALSGERGKAASALATLRRHDLAGLPRSSSWLGTLNGIVEAAHLLGDADTSAQAYRQLLPFAHLPVVGSIGVACFGSVHHALGVASLTTGDLDRAVEHLGAAVQQNLALAHWPAVIASRHRLAQALGRRARPADAANAEREVAAAALEATELGIALPADGAARPPKATLTCTREGRKWRLTLRARPVLLPPRTGVVPPAPPLP